MKPEVVRHTLARGIFHATLGLALVTALFFFPRFLVAGALAIVTAAFLAIELTRLQVPALRRWFHGCFALFVRKEEDSKLTGASYFLIGCLITAALFPTDIASLAIAYLALGDPAATAVGRWQGRVHLWNKTLEGHLACLIACIVAGILLVIIMEKPVPPVAIIGAIFATLFQALELRLNDNITIPVGSAIAMVATNAIIPAVLG